LIDRRDRPFDASRKDRHIQTAEATDGLGSGFRHRIRIRDIDDHTRETLRTKLSFELLERPGIDISGDNSRAAG
jgi:hypothetical protein